MPSSVACASERNSFYSEGREFAAQARNETLGHFRDNAIYQPLTWFSMHLDASSAYNTLKEEYYEISELWHSVRNHKSCGPYIQEAYGNGEFRKLNVNAQQIKTDYAGNGLYASEGPTKKSKRIASIISVNYPFEERLHTASHNEDTETVQYWPFMAGQQMHYMPYTITCLSSECKVSPTEISSPASSSVVYRLSILRVTMNNPVLGPQPELTVTHVCYYRWPDGRLPVPTEHQTAAEAAVALIEIVEKDLNWPSAHLLVHCHAGIGRTGTLMAILLATQQASDQHLVDVKETVQELRKSRAKAVMNYWQYIFVYLTIAEVLQRRGQLDPSSRGRLLQLWNELLSDIPRQFD